MLVYEELTHEILVAAKEVHKQIGPGPLESACTTNLKHREVLHKVQRPTGAGPRQWCGSTNWLAALPHCEECLCRELSLRGLSFQRQVPLAIAYKGVKLDCGYKLDLVVEDKVILELKSIKRIDPTDEAPLLSDLRLSGKKVGLLINFNTVLIKDGIKRMIL